jgi:hypothetical protein
MVRTLHTFTNKLDIEGFDIIKTKTGYQADYCGVETNEAWIAILVADSYEEASNAIKSISEGK